MFEIETKNLKISEELNRKIDMICRFACVKYEFIPGNIKSVKNTNIAYVKPHILKVKGNDYLILEECEEIIRLILLKDTKALKQNKLKLGVITINLDKVKEYYTEEYAKFIIGLAIDYKKELKQMFKETFA